MFGWDWRETLVEVLKYAAVNPWDFVFYVLQGK
jgi:hypothetical protein